LEGGARTEEALGLSAAWPPPVELLRDVEKLRPGLRLKVM
jgi:hypothetical protein